MAEVDTRPVNMKSPHGTLVTVQSHQAAGLIQQFGYEMVGGAVPLTGGVTPTPSDPEEKMEDDQGANPVTSTKDDNPFS